jgi:predicted nucleic acid-binding protein
VSLFVDTSVWYAALDRSDRSHEIAKQLLGHAESPAVTDHIVVETHRLASYRLGTAVGDTFLQTILGGAATVEPVTLPDLERAASVRARYPDQSFSLVDCTSFVVMERLRLNRVATFDDDYAVYRYGADGRRAFTVVR